MADFMMTLEEAKTFIAEFKRDRMPTHEELIEIIKNNLRSLKADYDPKYAISRTLREYLVYDSDTFKRNGYDGAIIKGCICGTCDGDTYKDITEVIAIDAKQCKILNEQDDTSKAYNHFTKRIFKEFDNAQIGTSHGTSLGHGIYLTPNELPEYGTALKVNVTLENPYILDLNNCTLDDIANYCEAWINVLN